MNAKKIHLNKDSIPKNNTEVLLIFKKELLALLKLLKSHQKTWNTFNKNIIEDTLPKFFGKTWNLKINNLEDQEYLLGMQNQIEEEELAYKKNKLLKLRDIELNRINYIHNLLKELPNKFYDIIEDMYTTDDNIMNNNTFANLRDEVISYIQEDRQLIINQTKEKIKEIYLSTIGNILTADSLRDFVAAERKKKEELIEENLLEGEDGKENIKSLVKEVLKPYIKKIKEQGKTIQNLKQMWNWNPRKDVTLPQKTTPKPTKANYNPNPYNPNPKWIKQGDKKKNRRNNSNSNPKPNTFKSKGNNPRNGSKGKYIPGYNPVKKENTTAKKSNYKSPMDNNSLLRDLVDSHKKGTPKNNKGVQSDMRNPFKLHATQERYNLLFPNTN